MDVFPTLVGVFLRSCCSTLLLQRLPHARGGVSTSASHEQEKHGVFPTLVGVFLPRGACPTRARGLPHARGGVSSRNRYAAFVDPSSPRSWGCFYIHRNQSPPFLVFPTLVGVFP